MLIRSPRSHYNLEENGEEQQQQQQQQRNNNIDNNKDSFVFDTCLPYEFVGRLRFVKFWLNFKRRKSTFPSFKHLSFARDFSGKVILPRKFCLIKNRDCIKIFYAKGRQKKILCKGYEVSSGMLTMLSEKVLGFDFDQSYSKGKVSY